MRNYARGLECGHSHLQAALPRLLTLFFELGIDCLTKRQTTNRERVSLTQARAGSWPLLHCLDY